MSTEHRIETRAIHAARGEAPTGDLAPPIHPSSSYEHGSPYLYARLGSPTRDTLERCLAALENTEAAAVFSSGTATAAAVFRTLGPADHIVASDDLYHGTRKLLRERIAADVSFVDTSDLDATRASLREGTKLLFCETPSNPLLKIADIAALSELAHDNGARCVVDNTWAPTLQRPLDLGADLVVYSTTKYVAGHGDLVGGAVAGGNHALEPIRATQREEGAVPSAFDCWLTLRGIRTLPYRMRIHSHNARRIAEHLATHPSVEQILYPGLGSHPGHDVARRQMDTPGGMLSFRVSGGRDAALAVAQGAELFVRATSLGGPESLIEHRASVEGDDTSTPDDLIRLSVGLEHPDDLIADLDRALG